MSGLTRPLADNNASLAGFLTRLVRLTSRFTGDDLADLGISVGISGRLVPDNEGKLLGINRLASV
jgi:hypothetical protein